MKIKKRNLIKLNENNALSSFINFDIDNPTLTQAKWLEQRKLDGKPYKNLIHIKYLPYLKNIKITFDKENKVFNFTNGQKNVAKYYPIDQYIVVKKSNIAIIKLFLYIFSALGIYISKEYDNDKINYLLKDSGNIKLYKSFLPFKNKNLISNNELMENYKINEHAIPTNEMEEFNNCINGINKSLDDYRNTDNPSRLNIGIVLSKKLTKLLTKIKQDCLKK